MLSKEARKELNTEFWEEFRILMRREKSSDGRGINWINYPTSVQDVYVRLETDQHGARFCFDIQPKDEGIRSILWEQMTELKTVMEAEMGPATAWNEMHGTVAGRNISRIYWETAAFNFYNREDRVGIQKFLREKLIAFDAFYQEFKEILILLAE